MQAAHAPVILSLAALAVYSICLVALHLLPTGYSPLRDPVSLYADGRYGALYALAQVAAGVCALGMAGALVEMRAPLPGVGLAGLVALGLARLLLVTVPARRSDRDVASGARPSRRVVIHQLLALVSFGLIALATLTLTEPVIAWNTWRGPAPLLIAAALITLAAVVLFFAAGFFPRLRPYFGLVQRAVYVGIILWQAVALIPLAR